MAVASILLHLCLLAGAANLRSRSSRRRPNTDKDMRFVT
jgi:hypothetical protein